MALSNAEKQRRFRQRHAPRVKAALKLLDDLARIERAITCFCASVQILKNDLSIIKEL